MRSIKFLYLIITLVLCGCREEKGTDHTVIHYGALMNIMSGNLEATASLDSIHDLPHLYALGALENLKGEIQIFDGESYVSKAFDNDSVILEPRFNHNAALLVYAQVDEWTNALLLKQFSDHTTLEQQIETHALLHGIDTDQPFPFLIKGKVDQLNWHVINWIDGDMEHNHKKHQESGAYGIIKNQEVEIIGFYSKKHKAVFTHHTTFLHMHFKALKHNIIAGHVDELKASDATLYLPK